MSALNLLGSPVKELLYCSPDDELLDVVCVLVNTNVNAIAVLDQKETLLGILTDYYILRALANARSDRTWPVAREWMTEKVIACNSDTKITDALRLMGKHGIRLLVITDCSIPVAILGIREVLAKTYEQDELEINVLRDIAIAARGSLAA